MQGSSRLTDTGSGSPPNAQPYSASIPCDPLGLRTMASARKGSEFRELSPTAVTLSSVVTRQLGGLSVILSILCR